MVFNIEAFKDALRASILLDLAEIDGIPEAALSDSDAVLRQIYERHENAKKPHRRIAGKRLLAILIAAILIIARAVTIIAYKEKLLDFFERKEDDYTSLTSPDSEGGNEEIKEVFLPAYIPEGFSVKSQEVSPLCALTYWSAVNKTIRLKQTPIMENERILDTENGDYVEAVFGNQPIYYVVNHNTFNAIWHTDDYVYNFTAPYDLGLEELERIISSITLNDSDT